MDSLHEITGIQESRAIQVSRNEIRLSIRKDSGKVTYAHIIGDPFSNKREVIGAYGVIRNSTGEYIEILNNDEIAKMRNSAKTDNIWKLRFDEMVKKSVIKRICKVNFRDIVHKIEEYDNENYTPESANFDHTLRDEIMECASLSDITAIFNREKNKVKDLKQLIKLCGARKVEIEILPGTKEWDDVVLELRNGTLLPDIQKRNYISDHNIESLLALCI